MTHASVFSGIGGPEVAATMLGWENLFHCEINPFGKRVLDYWYPNAKSYEDITKTDFTEWRGRVDVLTGGFPCQPFSYAGRRKGADDDRYLWPHMFRCIDEIRPTWVVAENVAGILTMVEQGEVSQMASAAPLFDEGDGLRGYRLRETFTMQRICDDLTSHGYAVQPILVPACAVGAPHRRDRVFIVGRRVASDTDGGADGRDTREDESTGRAQRLQERHEVRKPDEPGEIRPEGATVPEDSMHSRQLHGQDEVEGRERNIGNAGARGGERVCGETSGAAVADTLLLGGLSSRTSEAGKRDGIEKLSEQDGQRQGHASGGDSRLPRLSRNAPHPDSHRGCEVDEHLESELADGEKPVSNGGQRNVADTDNSGLQEARPEQSAAATWGTHLRIGEWNQIDERSAEVAGCGRWDDFPSVSPVHRGNDGLPFDVDRLTLSFGKWRTEALKAYGNAIVPQVMYELFRAIEIIENEG